jgi:SOS-response transcriptional repressor LexA
LSYIVSYKDAWGVAPSVRNIAGSMNRSTSTVQYQLDKLEAEGKITRFQHMARSIVVTKKEEDAHG